MQTIKRGVIVLFMLSLAACVNTPRQNTGYYPTSDENTRSTRTNERQNQGVDTSNEGRRIRKETEESTDWQNN